MTKVKNVINFQQKVQTKVKKLIQFVAWNSLDSSKIAIAQSDNIVFIYKILNGKKRNQFAKFV